MAICRRGNGLALFALPLAVLSTATFAGCPEETVAGEKKPQEQTTNPILIKRIGLEGTTQEASQVTVNAVADGDGQVDTVWSADFVLDNGTAENSLPGDNGAAQDYSLLVRSTPQAGGDPLLQQVRVELYAGTGADAGMAEDARAAQGEQGQQLGQGLTCAAVASEVAFGPYFLLVLLLVWRRWR